MFVHEPPEDPPRLLSTGRGTNLLRPISNPRPSRQNKIQQIDIQLRSRPIFLLSNLPEREKQAGIKYPPKTPRYVCEYDKAVFSTTTSNRTLTRRDHASTK